jgi:SAM-dependent methyltransferase
MKSKERQKSIEKIRYDERALAIAQNTSYSPLGNGSDSVTPLLRAPYIKYEKELAHILPQCNSTLELCAGMGEHTKVLLDHGKYVVATDISSVSLDVLRRRFHNAQKLEVITCDIEQLPFAPNSFDLVVCAGGLSYGDNRVVMTEILRVLRPGGRFICVDSLANNPLYQLNRIIHVLRGKRTRCTLKQMPSLDLISLYRTTFCKVECTFYGCFSWILLPISSLIGADHSLKISNALDNLCNIKRLAFKFVMTAQK